MTFNHEASTLTEVIGIPKDRMEQYFDEIVWNTFDKIRNDKEINEQEFAEILVHLVGVYDMHDELIIPILGSIYGYQSDEFTKITEVNVSYQIEAVMRYCDVQLKKYISGLYVMILIKDSNESKST